MNYITQDDLEILDTFLRRFTSRVEPFDERLSGRLVETALISKITNDPDAPELCRVAEAVNLSCALADFVQDGGVIQLLTSPAQRN